MIIIPLIYQFMNAKTFYRIIFVGNEPYRNSSEILNNAKRQLHQSGIELQGDDYWNILMTTDLYKSMMDYVRKFISGCSDF